MKKYYFMTFLVFFSFGMFTGLVAPKDYTVSNPVTPSEDTAVLIDAQNGCVTYRYPYKVGKNLQMPTKTFCTRQ